jgi:hypothetical protein
MNELCSICGHPLFEVMEHGLDVLRCPNPNCYRVLQHSDTYSLAQFVRLPRLGQIEKAKAEWLRRFGKQYPYHPSYENNTYPEC